MTKFGTPIGAGPNVRDGQARVGVGRASRRGCGGWAARSSASRAVATCLAPWPFLRLLAEEPRALGGGGLLGRPCRSCRRRAGAALELGAAAAGRRRAAATGAAGRRRSRRCHRSRPRSGRCTRRCRAGRCIPGRRGRQARRRRRRSGWSTGQRRRRWAVLTWAPPTVTEVAVPAAIIGRAAPRAMVTRSFLVIWLAVPARETRWVCRSRPPRTRRHAGRY